MSVTFEAIVNKGVPLEARHDLPNLLAQTSDKIIPALINLGFDRKRFQKATWKWYWDPDQDGEFQSWLVQPCVACFFNDPSDIALRFNTKAAVIDLGAVRWDSFTANPSVQEDVRSLICHLGSCLHADSAIYLPDTGWSAGARAVECITGGADFETASNTLVNEMRMAGSFPNPPRGSASAKHSKPIQSVCPVWQSYFDRWALL